MIINTQGFIIGGVSDYWDVINTIYELNNNNRYD